MLRGKGRHMAEVYRLMHKSSLCGILMIDEESGALVDYRPVPGAHPAAAAPFLDHATAGLMKKWWEARAVPMSRKTMQSLIRAAGCISPRAYLAKNLALSMTDTYWICPLEAELNWEDVKLYNASGFTDGHLPYHNASSYDPNASLGGEMDKYWDLNTAVPTLVKTAYREFGQQAVNELFATELHERQNAGIPFVRYQIRPSGDGGLQACCPAFTSESEELVPAMEVIESKKIPGSQSVYDAYIQICAENGIDEEKMRDFMDYQTLTDFVLSNTDEHLMNFGVLRDTDTFRMTAPAPIFDSGNSMFFGLFRKKALQRHELLEMKITGIHDKEERMLKHIRNRRVVRADLLPSPGEVSDFYQANGIPEARAKFIAGSYQNKLSLLQDFQKGKTISFYQEKKTAKEITKTAPQTGE